MRMGRYLPSTPPSTNLLKEAPFPSSADFSPPFSHPQRADKGGEKETGSGVGGGERLEVKSSRTTLSFWGSVVTWLWGVGRAP